jgi:hypothetical protein
MLNIWCASKLEWSYRSEMACRKEQRGPTLKNRGWAPTQELKIKPRFPAPKAPFGMTCLCSLQSETQWEGGPDSPPL